MSRLHLDFKLETREERVQFINNYLKEIKFSPNESELRTITDYILWGKENGLNGRQEGLEIETKNGTWDETHLESLDALIDTPGFNEASLRRPKDPPSKAPRQNFSRSRARRLASPHVLAALESLWNQIDTIELKLNFYELEQKKRTEIRQELLERFSDERIKEIQEVGRNLQPYTYLKLKHQLVELRREQYTYKDFYSPTIQAISAPTYTEYMYSNIGSDIPVYPIGITDGSDLWNRVFGHTYPSPGQFTEKEIKAISKRLYHQISKKDGEFFDFRNVDHLYELFGMYEELEDAVLSEGEDSFESSLKFFLDTLNSYRALAKNEDFLEDILQLKIKKKSNQQIADFINKKYGKTYKPNYISTLYCQKCLANIARAASIHMEVLENLSFPENFRRCKDCGEVLLLNADNFVRRNRDAEGFSPRCKACEKKKRDKRKETK